MCPRNRFSKVSVSGIRAVALIGAIAVAVQAQQLSVTLTPSTTSPAPVGTLVTWTATAAGVESGTFRYRFLVRDVDQKRRIVKDFGPDNTFDWSPVDHEGSYNIEVT